MQSFSALEVGLALALSPCNAKLLSMFISNYINFLIFAATMTEAGASRDHYMEEVSKERLAGPGSSMKEISLQDDGELFFHNFTSLIKTFLGVV